MLSDYLTIAQSYMPFFHKMGEKYFISLAGCPVPLQVNEMAYEGLLREGRIGPIEDMMLLDKEFLWTKAKEYGGRKLGKIGLLRLVKSIVLVDYFLNVEVN